MPAMEENVLKRILPHSVEAEQSVIGSMIMDREAIVVASELISGEDFYNKMSPAYMIISCGKDNDYNHPHKEITDYIDKNNRRVYGNV